MKNEKQKVSIMDKVLISFAIIIACLSCYLAYCAINDIKIPLLSKFVESAKNDTKIPEVKEDKKVENMSFDKFEAILKDNGYTISEKTTMAAQIVGGKEGIKYETNNGSFELYRFDISSDAYKKAKENGSVTLDGFGDFPVVMNKDFILLTNDVSQKIIDAFSK